MKKIKMKNKGNLIIFILFVAAFLFMSVGFAAYNQTVSINGTAVLIPDGIIYIKSVRLVSSQRATANPEVNNSGFVDFNLSFQTQRNQETGYNATFEIIIANESSYDYTYTVPNYRPTASRNNVDYSGYIDYSIQGISSGDIIPSKTEKAITVAFTFRSPDTDVSGTYIIDGDFIPDFTEDVSATLRGTVDETQVGDLRNPNTLALYEISVMNTYNVPKTFTITTDSDKFEIRNLSDTGVPQYTIPANTTEQVFQFYLKIIPGSDFVSDSDKARISITPTGENDIYAGRVTALVDRTIFNFIDTTPPTISNVTATIQNTNGSVYLTWNGEDDSGESVQNYTIICYNSSGTEVSRRTTTGDVEEYTYTGLSAGSYYFVVFGTDQSGNSATASDISSATTSAGPACKTGNAEQYKWVFTVTKSNMSNCSCSGNNTVNRGDTYTATITPNNNYNTPTNNQVTVTMGGQQLTTSSVYRNGTITIPNVTGDIVITAEASRQGCLVEGTKVLLANGNYKNIEDIKYTDLLRVYNHVTGEMINVYPIWIEEEGIANTYRKVTFSDGSFLKVVSNHSVFDVDNKKYIDVANDNECKIGTRVYKVEDDKLKVVTITNIEDINESVKFYNIVSTMYYNIIANGILTTDATSSISNIYGFEDNAIYGENYYVISNGEKLEYEDVSFIPYYLYKGLNLQNAKCLIDNGLDLDFLSSFINVHTLKSIK